jgi:diguanylate cyclase (GGDEF)-like protein
VSTPDTVRDGTAGRHQSTVPAGRDGPRAGVAARLGLRHACIVRPTLAPFSEDDPPPRLVLPSISLTWTLLLIGIALLLGQALLGFAAGRNGPADLALAVAVALLVASAVLNARASGIALARREAEAQAFNRLVQALSRALSPEAVIDAIVQELGDATQADHVAVVQMRPDSAELDLNLVSMLPGGQAVRAVMPVRQLDPLAARRLRTVSRPHGGLALVLAGPRSAAEEFDDWRMRRTIVAAEPAPGPGWRAWIRQRRSRLADPPESPYSTDARDIADQIAYRLRDAYGLRSTLAAPLAEGEWVFGAIVLSRRTADPWSGSVVRLLDRAAAETAAALARVYSHQAAEEAARTDQLTALPNRRYFDDYCRMVTSRRRASDRVAILAVDVDHFKRLNDMYGHQIGDIVLRAIAGAIQMSVRDDDMPARYGGEEFMVLIRNPGPGVAVEVGERIRTTVREMNLIDSGVTDRVTVSVGVASSHLAGEPIADIVERADRALYAAKRAGRDRVVEDPN